MSDTADYPWLSVLNEPQRKAAIHKDGPLLILAGAGSGKTRAIVHRIAHLIMGHGVDPFNILAVTFTNKAAEEMRNRVASMLGAESAGAWVSTFHSMGSTILRRHIESLGYPGSFVIYDDTDQTSLLKRVIKDKGMDPKKLTPQRVRYWLDYLKRGPLAETSLENVNEPGAARYMDIIVEYQRRLKEANAVDFGDLLLLTYKLFEKDKEVLDMYRERFQYIMVDEYQDTNRIQYLIARKLAAGRNNICVVGDEDQSIYSWRGADIRNILDFENDFPGATVIYLEQNYRSTGTVIEAASDLISMNLERKPKRLWTDNEQGDPIRQYAAVDERDEARWLLEEVLRLRGMGTDLSEMAVFYRTHAQSRVIEDSLRSVDLPYSVYGGPSFYGRKEVKDILGYLKFVENPDDEVSFLRIVNVPARGVGAKSVEEVIKERRMGEGDWIEAADTVVKANLVAGKGRTGLVSFIKLMDALREKSSGSITALCADVIEKSGYRKALEDEATDESLNRIENLDELINAMAEHEAHSDDPTLRGFLEKVSLATDMDKFEPGSGRLTLMTIHSAKGLEFPVVFMVGMEEGVFPHLRSVKEDEAKGTDTGVEEERRLCYVGMTRARRQLFMSWTMSRMFQGKRERSEMSRFIQEIPSRHVKITGASAGLRRPTRKGESKPEAQRSIDFGDSEIVFDDMGENEDYPFRPGDRVYHPAHGEGTIKRFEDSGAKLKVVVRFAGSTKKFSARFAPLEPVD